MTQLDANSVKINNNIVAIASVASGTPRTNYATLALLTAGIPTGNIYSYVCTDGHRYYWNGTAWTDGGVYQATSIAGDSINLYESSIFDKTNILLSVGKFIFTFANVNAWQVKTYTFNVANLIGKTLSLYIKSVTGNIDTQIATMYFLDSNGTRISANTLTLSTILNGDLLVPVGAVTLRLCLMPNGSTAGVVGTIVTWTGVNLVCGQIKLDKYIYTGEQDILTLNNSLADVKNGNIDLSNSPLKFGVLKYINFILSLTFMDSTTHTLSASTVRSNTNFILGDGKNIILIDVNKNVKAWVNEFDNNHTWIRQVVASNISCDNLSFATINGNYYMIQFGYLDSSAIDLLTLVNNLVYYKSDTMTISDLITKYMSSESTQRHPSSIKSIAHQGYNLFAPPNTIPAIFEASKHGFEWAECDIQWTSDNVAVICHNGTIDATSNGIGTITSMTLATLKTYDFGAWKSTTYAGTRIPTFEEHLLACKKYGLKLVIDHLAGDTQTHIQILLDIIKKYGMLRNVAWSCGLDLNTTAGMILSLDSQAIIVGGGTSWQYITDTDSVTGLPTINTNDLTALYSVYPNCKLWVSQIYSILTLEQIVKFRSFFPNAELFTWAVDDKTIYEQWLPYVDGIFSNQLNNEDVLWS